MQYRGSCTFISKNQSDRHISQHKVNPKGSLVQAHVLHRFKTCLNSNRLAVISISSSDIPRCETAVNVRPHREPTKDPSFRNKFYKKLHFDLHSLSRININSKIVIENLKIDADTYAIVSVPWILLAIFVSLE